jgi:hypothetical protein
VEPLVPSEYTDRRHADASSASDQRLAYRYIGKGVVMLLSEENGYVTEVEALRDAAW